jgi:hypothetical protein
MKKWVNKMDEFQEKVIKIVNEYQKGRSFTEEKLTDTPTEALSLVNRRYVNLNGTVANRPNSSVAIIGQRYFATDIASGTPITWSGTNWVNGVGSVILVN